MTLKRLLLAVSMCCLVTTANAAPIDDAWDAYNRSDYAQALRLYRPLAEKGDVDAQYKIGTIYWDGLGITKSYQEALKWFRLAARQGNMDAQYNLGVMYGGGQGVLQDYNEALKWYRLAAAQSHEGAIENLKSPNIVAAALASPTPQHIHQSQDYKRLIPLAKQGNADAQYNLGVMYEGGQRVLQDYKEALKWYRLAAAQSHEGAIENLKSPNIVAAALPSPTPQPIHQSQDYKRLIPLAKQGNADAQYNLGVMYFTGFGVTESTHEALKWFRLAARQGHIRAKSYLDDPELIGAAQQYQQTYQPTTQPKSESKTDMTSAMSKCSELGFKKGTEKFGDCVLKLSK